ILSVCGQCYDERLAIIIIVDAHEAWISAAGPRAFGPRQDRAHQLIRRVATHEESRDADGRAEEDLAALALDERSVRDVRVRDPALRLIFERERGDQDLQVNRARHIADEALEKTVVAPLEAGEPGHREFAHPIK